MPTVYSLFGAFAAHCIAWVAVFASAGAVAQDAVLVLFGLYGSLQTAAHTS